MYRDYKELIKKVGEDDFQSRLEELTRLIDTFLQEAGFNDYAACNERILYHVLLDYYSDIFRLEEFHEIAHPKTDKITAYLIYWILRRKPIQFLCFSEDEKDIFVNERFACTLLLNECLLEDNDYKLNKTVLEKADAYLDLILYYFKYRPYNAQVIELLIESFKMGRYFPITTT